MAIIMVAEHRRQFQWYKYRMKKVFLLVMALLLFFNFTIPSGIVKAKSVFTQGERITLGSMQVVEGNYYAAGENIVMEGTVNGDAYLAGGDVEITGIVNGDVLAAAGKIRISGTVTGDIRLFGGQLAIDGQVGNNITTVGGQIILSKDSSVLGNLTAAGGSVRVNTPMSGDVNVAGGELEIGDNVSGDVNFAGNSLRLLTGAAVNGDISYISQEEASIESGASFSGKLNQTIPPVNRREVGREAGKLFAGFAFFAGLSSFISSLVLGLLLVAYFRKNVLSVTSRMWSGFLPMMGWGFVILFLAPAVFIFLLTTVLGIPLAFAFLAAFLLSIFVVRIYAAVFLGQLVLVKLFKNDSLYLSLVVGLVLYYLLWVLPVVGWIIKSVVFVAAVGAIRPRSISS